MTKEVNWDMISKSVTPQKRGKYSSGKEMLAKAFEAEKQQDEAKELMNKAYPVMEQLFQIRFKNGTPLTVMRPLQYQSSELQKGYGRPTYIDTQKVVRPGTVMTLTGVDPNLQEFIFKSDQGEEIAIPYINKNALYTQTDIYEVTKEYLEGE